MCSRAVGMSPKVWASPMPLAPRMSVTTTR